MPETKQNFAAVLWVLAAVQFLAPFMFSAIGVALPTIGREFSAGAVQLGLIEMVYILAMALLLLPIGRFADIHGRRKIFLAGTVLLTLATLALAAAPTITLLIVCRFVQGMGAAMITSTSFAILTSVCPPEKRGRAMGVVVGCVYLGISAGPTLAGLMIDVLGWRWIFYSAVPVELLVLRFAAIRLQGEWADSQGEPFALTGSLLCVTALTCLIVGILERGLLHRRTCRLGHHYRRLLLQLRFFRADDHRGRFRPLFHSQHHRHHGQYRSARLRPAASLIATMRTAGMLTAMTLIALLLSWFPGREPVTPATGERFWAAMRTAMVIFSLLGCAAILCSLGRTSTCDISRSNELASNE